MKQFCCTLLFFLATLTSYAQNFADFFQDKTLRVDYIFTGDANRQAIYLDELSQLPSWAGRQHHLSELPLAGKMPTFSLPPKRVIRKWWILSSNIVRRTCRDTIM